MRVAPNAGPNTCPIVRPNWLSDETTPKILIRTAFCMASISTGELMPEPNPMRKV